MMKTKKCVIVALIFINFILVGNAKDYQLSSEEKVNKGKSRSILKEHEANIPSQEEIRQELKKISVGDKETILALKNRIENFILQNKPPTNVDLLLLRAIPDKIDTGIFLKKLFVSINPQRNVIHKEKIHKKNIIVPPSKVNASITDDDLRGIIFAEMILNFYANPKPSNNDGLVIEDELNKLLENDLSKIVFEKIIIALLSKQKEGYNNLWFKGVNYLTVRILKTEDSIDRFALIELMYSCKIFPDDMYAGFLETEYLQNKGKKPTSFYLKILVGSIIRNKELFKEKFIKEVYKTRDAFSLGQPQEFNLSGYCISIFPNPIGPCSVNTSYSGAKRKAILTGEGFEIIIENDHLFVNGKKYGSLKAKDSISINNGIVYVSGTERMPE